MACAEWLWQAVFSKLLDETGGKTGWLRMLHSMCSFTKPSFQQMIGRIWRFWIIISGLQISIFFFEWLNASLFFTFSVSNGSERICIFSLSEEYIVSRSLLVSGALYSLASTGQIPSNLRYSKTRYAVADGISTFYQSDLNTPAQRQTIENSIFFPNQTMWFPRRTLRITSYFLPLSWKSQAKKLC